MSFFRYINEYEEEDTSETSVSIIIEAIPKTSICVIRSGDLDDNQVVDTGKFDMDKLKKENLHLVICDINSSDFSNNDKGSYIIIPSELFYKCKSSITVSLYNCSDISIILEAVYIYNKMETTLYDNNDRVCSVEVERPCVKKCPEVDDESVNGPFVIGYNIYQCSNINITYLYKQNGYKHTGQITNYKDREDSEVQFVFYDEKIEYIKSDGRVKIDHDGCPKLKPLN